MNEEKLKLEQMESKRYEDSNNLKHWYGGLIDVSPTSIIIAGVVIVSILVLVSLVGRM